MQVPKRSSYATDDTAYLVDFFNKESTSEVVDKEDADNFSEAITGAIPDDQFTVDVNEGNALFYVAGWVAFKLRTSNTNSCNDCLSAVVSDCTSQHSNPLAQLLRMKTHGGLAVPSTALFQLICEGEKLFRSLRAELNFSHNVTQTLSANSASVVAQCELPNCHNIAAKALDKFFRLCTYIWAKHFTNAISAASAVQHGSKSAKARTSIV